eukprot:TRINITY_DN14989_c0_g1_i1.p1 TRINITY_DN14989_c0_g1~~TRINITY_DN14989_c0_g1_i1.p1  ORF type:complete len:372 (-),score=126.26 TRINITY_DN14989_c0_g1_i1:210-1325(-)
MIKSLLCLPTLQRVNTNSTSFITKSKYVPKNSNKSLLSNSSSKISLVKDNSILNPCRYRWNKDPVSKPKMPVLSVVHDKQEQIESDDPRHAIESRMFEETEVADEDDEMDDGDVMSGRQFEYNDYFEKMGQDMRLPLSYGGTVNIGRHTSIKAAGRVFSFSALVVAGDGQGTAGMGYGKGWDAANALDKARNDIFRNLTSVYRFEDRTIPKDITVKYRATKLIIRRHKKGAGLRGHPNLTLFAQCFGMKDLLIKIHGSRNMNNCLRALEIGLRRGISPAEEARQKGKVYIDTSKILKPERGETPFKFNNISSHSIWEDPRYFRRSEAYEDGVYVFGRDETNKQYDDAINQPIEELERKRKEILEEQSNNQQ